jgi:hypothetical protein
MTLRAGCVTHAQANLGQNHERQQGRSTCCPLRHGENPAERQANESDGQVATGPESIGSHVGSIYRPGVRNSTGEFSPSQPIAANPFFKGPTDDCRCLLPIGIRWIKRGRNRHKRVARVPNGNVEGEGQADIAHCHTYVVGDCVERLPDDVALAH